MRRRLILFAFASLAAGCGARSDLDGDTGSGTTSDTGSGTTSDTGSGTSTSSGTTSSSSGSGPAHIYVSDIRNAPVNPGKIVQMDDLEGTNYKALSGDGSIFDSSCGLAVGEDGTIYFADDNLKRVASIKDVSGADPKHFGSPGTGKGQFSELVGVAVDGAGRIYIADHGANRIARIDDMSGSGWVTLGGPDEGSGEGHFDQPQGVAVSRAGKILISDNGNRRVVQIDDMSGSGWSEWQLPDSPFGKGRPAGVAYDVFERIYVVDFQGSMIHRIDNIDGDGHASFHSDDADWLLNVAADDTGRIYATLLNGLKTIIAMDDIDGTNLEFYKGTPDGDNQLNGPCGIAVK
jgi:streptogramin lyase